jgi:CHAT domain-containing protein
MGRLALAVLLLLSMGCVQASESELAEGIAQRNAGNISNSIAILSALHASTADAGARTKSAGELGASLLQAGRLDEAQAALTEAVAGAAGAQRARYTLDLGNVAAGRKRLDEAQALYADAVALAGGDAQIQAAAQLNLARLADSSQRLALLEAIARRLPSIREERVRAAYQINVGYQAQGLGDSALELAYAQLDAARKSATALDDARLKAEALDALAGLYEEQQRPREALALARQGLAAARTLDRGRVADLLISLEWRSARLAAALGEPDLALASYQRAVESIEAVRPDIPIEYDDGRSTFRATLEPVYLGYADQLFRRAASLPAAEQAATLRRVRDVVELVRQAELQDYLRDRCEVEAIQRAPRSGVGKGVAILYPITFPDRIELLLETDAGIAWRTTAVPASTLRITARAFANDLRSAAPDYIHGAQTLYRWLLRPVEETLREQGVTTLIVVPEGTLRLVAMNALHDGQRFAIEKWAIGTVTGLTMTNTEPPAASAPAALIAGMSRPGGVVDKLPRATVAAVLGESAPSDPVRRSTELRDRLALPGVKEEVDSVVSIVHGRRMLDEEFTVKAFQAQAKSGDYRIVHIASHGVFGGSADASYIMAFDDILTMQGLQSLLREERFRRNPIELLSLSACQTAEGDDRSPLGISGAAVKARAKSVLGTLWPVEDAAARIVMEKFYANIAREHIDKVTALQRAQVETLKRSEFSHPFYWAPFVLIGNWL